MICSDIIEADLVIRAHVTRISVVTNGTFYGGPAARLYILVDVARPNYDLL